MFSYRTVILVFIFYLIAIVGSTNGQSGCGSSPSREEMYDEQSRANGEAIDRMNRINLSCDTTGGGGGGGGNGGGFVTIIDIFVGLFFLIWVVIGIWLVFVRRQKIMNAALVNPYPAGDVGAKEMGYGIDEKTNTVGMTGKLPNGDNNV